MPTWINIAIWIVWGVWTLDSIHSAFVMYAVYEHNTGPQRHFSIRYVRWGIIVLFVFYIIATIFWICWNIFG